MKIVIDTNVILSALITQGVSYRVLEICLDKHELYISNWIVKEVKNKLSSKFKVPKDKINRVLLFLEKAFKKILPKGKLPEVCRDANDNNILHLAEYVNAELIVTGDKDLLVLKKYKNVKITNPLGFMRKYHV